MTSSQPPTRVAAIPALALGLTLLLAGCGGGSTSPGSDGGDPRPIGSSTSEPVPDPTDDVGADDDTPAEPEPDSCGLTDDDYAIIRDALQTADLAPITGYLAPTVYVTYAASEYEGEVSGNPGLVLQNLEEVSYPGPAWTFDIPAADLAVWAASPYYAEDFTECAIVGITSDDRGVSLTVSGGLIVREMITLSVDAWGY